MTTQRAKRAQLIEDYLQTFDDVGAKRPLRKRRGQAEIDWIANNADGRLQYSSLRGMVLDGARGFSFLGSTGRDISMAGATISDCCFMGVSFPGINLAGAAINDCSLVGADLRWANVDHLSIVNSSMAHSNLSNVKGDDMVFMGCDLTGMRLTPSGRYACSMCTDASPARVTSGSTGGRSYVKIWKGDRLITEAKSKGWNLLSRLREAKGGKTLTRMASEAKVRCFNEDDRQALFDNFGINLDVL